MCAFPYALSVTATYLASIKTDFSILYTLDDVLKKTHPLVANIGGAMCVAERT